jgi:predicted O-linked N-acetylglucosamine transferase (SPINDLY family)
MQIWYNLGIVHKDLGNHQLAAKSFRKAYRLSAHYTRNEEVSQDEVQKRKADRMKFLTLAVEQSNKACDWRHLHELLPVLMKRLATGDAVALQATDPYESLLYVNSAATSLRVAKQHIATADRNREDSGAVSLAFQYKDWLNLATSLRVGILSADMRHHPVAQTLLGVLQSIREHHGLHVHLVVFSMCPDKQDDNVQRAIRSHVDSWHTIHGITDEAAAQMVSDEGIHVLLEMQGHTLHRRIGIALRRPAPVAISMQGFPASTGVSLETLPYLLADKVVLPPELATPDMVSEQVMYMPFSFIACGYQRSLSIPMPQLDTVDQSDPGSISTGNGVSSLSQQRGSGSAPKASTQRRHSWVDVDSAWGQELDHLRLDAVVQQLRDLLTQYPSLNKTTELRQAGISVLAEPSPGVERGDVKQQASPVVNNTAILLRLCANNRAAKVDGTAMTLWSNVLRRTQRQWQFWMDGQFHDAKRNLLMEAAARGHVNGVDAGRDRTYEDYMQRLGHCDLFLDTLTYGAHTVGLDALYMGLPIITVAGGQMANRVGASLMTAVGGGINVEPSLKAYEDTAVAHLNAKARQRKDGYLQRIGRLSRAYHPVLPTPSRASPLFDDSVFAGDLVTAMQKVWEHARAVK